MATTTMLNEKFTAAIKAGTKDERSSKAKEFATAVSEVGISQSVFDMKLNEALAPVFENSGKKAAGEREAACFVALELFTLIPGSALLLLPSFSQILAANGVKQKPVAAAAEAALRKQYEDLSTYAPSLLLSELNKDAPVPAQTIRFELLADLCVKAPCQIPTQMLDSIRAAIPYTTDLRDETKTAAQAALTAICETCVNPDMDAFIPELVNSMRDNTQISETVFKMASTTFISEVEQGTLSIMEPVLSFGLSTKSTTITKRQCAKIIANMSKLIDEPRHLSVFLPTILPMLETAQEKEKDQECRNVCSQAVQVLKKKSDAGVPLTFNTEQCNSTFFAALKEVAPEKADLPQFQALYKNIVAQTTFVAASELDEADKVSPWTEAVIPALTLVAGIDEASATQIADKLREASEASRVVVVEDDFVDDGAEVLCDLQFGLAYGNKVLLRKTRLHLVRGHKYGLLGQNDSGKTSLLKSLAEYKIDGFPSAEECRTVFVETDIKTELADLSVLDYMYNDPLLQSMNIEKSKMEETLNSVGFKEGAPANTTQKVGTLSGGWRMKLALSRAILLKADILLLDEPTNHLDAYNVNWVETYLKSLTNVTAIMVSHDSGLLTRVCTDIIEIDAMKLNFFRGNLESFVAAKPEAKAYFELAKEGKYNFNFPTPGELPGVKSKGKAILKMTNIGFTYPGVAKAQLKNVTVQVSLSSRVACVGENGAGKSTMIKLLTGELEPDEGSGEVWKHPNCRIGYIAQHAFHHIEQHMDMSANDYIRWRYANGGDKEELVKTTSICTEEEIAQMEKPFEIPFTQEDGTVVKIGYVVRSFTEKRRPNKKKEDEYECNLAGPFTKNKAGVFVGSADGATILGWVSRELLYRAGFEKVIKVLDEKIAMRATTFARPLTKENVQKHIADVGLEPEFSTHMQMKALSGGQKVKVVLAAALWNQPHILILDEPTNYLDRESLGALARAIHAFEGGVVMITHNSQFCDNLCPTVWHLQNNTLDVKGDAEWMAEAAKAEVAVTKISEEDLVDRFGNTIELNGKKAKTKKELKQKAMRRKKRAKATGEDYDSSDWSGNDN